jgi:deoxyribodipyrimidine photo-lyase
MATVADRWGDDARVEIWRDGEPAADASCVMLWVQRSQRARANPASNLAVELAKELDLPVIAVFAMTPGFPSATLRAYHFMAEGLATLPDDFAARGIGWQLEIGDPVERIPAAARKLGSAVVITDVNPLRIGREWRRDVADALDVPLVAVDGDVVVPSSLFPKEEYAARTIRPKIYRVLDEYLHRIPDPLPPVASSHREGPDPLAALDSFDLDRSVAPAPDRHGGSDIARDRMRTFVAERLATYHEDRSRADIEAGTGLSPYLHFGQIAPMEVALAVRDADVPQEARDSMFNELIVQRELSINNALRNPDYDRYEGLPDWARKTLAQHASDPRPEVYSYEEFDEARTDDDLWNAAMTQIIHEGFMPNRLRMYWGKQILRWTESPQDAWEIAVRLNDRYFIDGRDANSYANIAWCIGGRHDRPFGPERDIFGIVRPMGMGAMKRTFDVKRYIDQVRSRWG